MHIVICLDDRNGMMFNKRRLSSDQTVCQRIVQQAAGVLWMSSYSAKLFEQYLIRVDDDFLNKAAAGDTCFVETPDFTEFNDVIQTITVYRWNRSYPADKKLASDYFSQWQLTETIDFPGNSHENITEEKYTKL